MHMKKGEQVAVLMLDGQVVCYASYSIRRDLQSLSICKLAVEESQRRQGLGRSMLRHLIQVAKCRNRGEAALKVVCLSSLPSSVYFYKACGFRADVNVKVACCSD